MEQTYELRISEPGPELSISVANREAHRESGETVFGAGLQLRRHPLSLGEMTRLALRPPAALSTLARIYAQGVRLRLKGAPPHPHPGARASSA